MKVSIVGKGDKIAFKSAENLAARTRFGIQKALWASGKDILGEFNRQVLGGEKTGKIYIRRNRAGARRKHQASAPGETPANMTGRYRRGASFNVRRSEMVFGDTEEHALYLELGTSRMKKRPGLSNAIKSSEGNVIRNFTTDISEAL